MLIEAKHNHCIWCRRLFRISGFRSRPGQVCRSEEHIFPKSLFGRLLIQDVCEGCNGKLGHAVDARILDDGPTILAGQAAGFTPAELLRDFRVDGELSDGRKFQYRVRSGNWQLRPSFSESGFSIGCVDGRHDESDLSNAKRKLLKVVMQRRIMDLTVHEARLEIEKLFDAFIAGGGQKEVGNRRINQSLRGVSVPSFGAMRIQTEPWETQWCIAKISYETAAVLLPEQLRMKVHSALTQLKDFVMAQEVGRHTFASQTLAVAAAPLHIVEVAVRGSKLLFTVRMFAREQFRLEFTITQYGRSVSLPAYRLEVQNDCRRGVDEAVMITEEHEETGPEALRRAARHDGGKTYGYRAGGCG